MSAITLHIGPDVHKDSITFAIAQAGCPGEIRLLGTMDSRFERERRSGASTLIGSTTPLDYLSLTLTISTEISAAGVVPLFSSQCVVFLSSGQPTPGP